MYAGGDDIEKLAWYSANSNRVTHPVGEKEPNGLGLFDMSGNVWEWCQDSFSQNAYNEHAEANPVYLDNKTDYRVLRGGSYMRDARSCRTTYRFNCQYSTSILIRHLGLRLVCSER